MCARRRAYRFEPDKILPSFRDPSFRLSAKRLAAEGLRKDGSLKVDFAINRLLGGRSIGRAVTRALFNVDEIAFVFGKLYV